jgi:hypothetical protein
MDDAQHAGDECRVDEGAGVDGGRNERGCCGAAAVGAGRGWRGGVACEGEERAVRALQYTP